MSSPPLTSVKGKPPLRQACWALPAHHSPVLLLHCAFLTRAAYKLSRCLSDWKMQCKQCSWCWFVWRWQATRLTCGGPLDRPPLFVLCDFFSSYRHGTHEPCQRSVGQSLDQLWAFSSPELRCNCMQVRPHHAGLRHSMGPDPHGFSCEDLLKEIFYMIHI